MIRAYHAIFSAYGFWLPNDPRGSWSDFVRSWELLRFGKATKVDTRRSLAKQPCDHSRRQAAKQSLKYPAVQFSGRQALSVAQGFQRAMGQSAYVLHSCSILPEHVHLVVARHRRAIETIVGHLKGRATQQLITDGHHPLDRYRQADDSHPSPWSRRGWNVFLDTHQAVRRAIEYVRQNPVREGKPLQQWSFVAPYPV